MEAQWAVVELMGHVRIAGLLSEEERFGSKVGRIDIPSPIAVCMPCGGSVGKNDACEQCRGKGAVGGGFVTQFFGGSSVYRITFVSEEAARAVAKSSQPQPIHSWEMPKQLAASARSDYDDGHDEEF